MGEEFVLPPKLAVAEVTAMWRRGAVDGFHVSLLFVFASESRGAVDEIAGYATGACYALPT
jgi:hypothetical protein